MSATIRTALERLIAAVKPKYTDPEEIVEAASAVLAALAALKAEPEGPANPSGYAYRYHDYSGGTYIKFNGGGEVNGGRPIEAVPYWFAPPSVPTTPPTPETPAEALAARPLLEQVAAMADCIGAQTVGQITAIGNRAAAWLRQNPPGQQVAIEPRGCPTPGACSCVEPAPPAPESEEMQGLVIGLREVSLVLDTMKAPRLAAALTRTATLLQQQATELAALRGALVSEQLQIVKAGIRAGYNLGHHHTVEGGWGDPDEVADDIAQETLDDLGPLPAPQAGEVQP